MHSNIELKGLDDEKTIRKLIAARLGRIEKKTRSFAPDPDTIYFRLMADENPARTLYRVSITLSTPEKTLAAHAEGHELNETVREALDDVERQLDAHKATLRGEYVWKRRTRREELRKLQRGLK